MPDADPGGVAGPERPHLHFTPPSGWLNDPNGLVHVDGTWHLCYQHHPDSLVWGPMHWGRATSRDLLHWEHHPIAFRPDHLGAAFSGSGTDTYWTSSPLADACAPSVAASVATFGLGSSATSR